MSELIGIREAARRLGVSDTAVRKAISAGRVTVAGRTDGSNRPLLSWPEAKEDYLANTNELKRTHVGGTGKSAKRATYATTPPEVSLPVRPSYQDNGENDDEVPDTAPAGAKKPRVPPFAESRAINEAYKARLAKLEFEEKSGKLVNADEVKAAWFKHITAAKTRIMGIPSACKTRRADLPLEVIALIESICRDALEDLSNGNS